MQIWTVSAGCGVIPFRHSSHELRTAVVGSNGIHGWSDDEVISASSAWNVIKSDEILVFVLK